MIRRLTFCVAAVLAIGACSDAPTNPSETPRPEFITHGQLDGDAHPAVVLVVMDVDDVPTFLCSGTLLSPTIVLTAGHCAGEPNEFSGIRIFTESDVENGNNNFPFAGPNSVVASDWAAHPQFTNAAFFLHDVGVLELSEPVTLPIGAQFGTLPAVNQLNTLRPRSSTRFTSVGYGVQRINPVKIEFQLIRMKANPHLIQINRGIVGSFSLLLSNNASTGGTCFGDSGGPNYVGSSNVIAGVTSFALNGTCGGTGGVFRLDRADVLAFVGSFLD